MPPLTCPPIPKNLEPLTYDDLTLWALTVLLEAEGEPDEGKLAVAWVIRNRMDAHQRGAREIILAPKQFSCWNPDYIGQRKARLTAPDPKLLERCWRAAAAAAWRLTPDPTGGSKHYYNPALANPEWARGAASVAIGRHVFLTGVA
jgi:spore germination cell wall hydrolase CwlJ-like protein